MLGAERKLEKAVTRAASYEEWREAAAAYDRHHKLDRWRRKDHTSQFDYVSIRVRLDALRSPHQFLTGFILLFVAVLTLIGMLVSDLLLAVLDPRIRLGGAASR